MYNGFQVAPSATLIADNVRIIIYPVEYARTNGRHLSGARTSNRGGAGDRPHRFHAGSGGNRSLSRDLTACGSSF